VVVVVVAVDVVVVIDATVVVVVDFGVVVAVDELHDTKTSDATMIQVNTSQISPLFIYVSFFFLKY
jgi:hypothetical protein